MKIRQTIERAPGGMMIMPMLAGALAATFAPAAGAFFGSFTGALLTGALPILAVFFVCTGATISIRSLPALVRRGGALLAAKIALGVAAGALFGHLLGREPVASGRFAGFSTLAIVAAMNDTNGGLYMALMRRYGTAEEAASCSILALESGPFLTMVTLGVAGLTAFPWQTLVGAVLPLVAGMVLGNLDPEMGLFLGGGAPVLIPFFAFSLGNTLDLHTLWAAGARGLLLGAAILLLSAICLVPIDRLVGGDGTAGMAASTTAGNAAAVPLLVAAADSHYARAARPATVLVASSVVITSFAAPLLTAWWHRRAARLRARRSRA